MSKNDSNALIYYQREIEYLRKQGAIFAAKYPKVAKRLNFGDSESSDPHTERLIESFAYMVGYLQQDIDDQFPRISNALLNVLYPQLTAPLPPLSIAEFHIDPNKGKLTTGYTVPKGFSLFAKTKDGNDCKFQTCCDLTLWPVEIADAQVVAASNYDFYNPMPYASFLKINLKSFSGALGSHSINQLRFYINIDPAQTGLLYELLFKKPQEKIIILGDTNSEPIFLNPHSLKQVGFKDTESLVPIDNRIHPAYRILQEYFNFPNKFWFFEITNLNFSTCNTMAEILIPLANTDSNSISQLRIQPNNIKLWCTPIVNLFSKNSEPLRFDKKQIEYDLILDIQRQAVTETIGIKSVKSVNSITGNVKELSPYFSFNHQDIEDQQTLFWNARRVPSINPDFPGTSIKLGFVDSHFSPHTPALETVYAEVLASNRGLASFVDVGTILEADGVVPAHKITALTQPTATLYPDMDSATEWQLISQLSLSYLSLSSDAASLTALKETLRLYAKNANGYDTQAIESIMDMTCTPVIRRIGKDAVRGLVKGTNVTLTINDKSFAQKDLLLFGTVLSHFFGLYAAINSFTELSIKKINEDQIWKTWKPIAGDQVLL